MKCTNEARSVAMKHRNDTTHTGSAAAIVTTDLIAVCGGSAGLGAYLGLKKHEKEVEELQARRARLGAVDAADAKLPFYSFTFPTARAS
jgi:hypothetical protein